MSFLVDCETCGARHSPQCTSSDGQHSLVVLLSLTENHVRILLNALHGMHESVIDPADEQDITYLKEALTELEQKAAQ